MRMISLDDDRCSPSRRESLGPERTPVNGQEVVFEATTACPCFHFRRDLFIAVARLTYIMQSTAMCAVPGFEVDHLAALRDDLGIDSAYDLVSPLSPTRRSLLELESSGVRTSAWRRPSRQDVLAAPTSYGQLRTPAGAADRHALAVPPRRRFNCCTARYDFVSANP